MKCNRFVGSKWEKNNSNISVKLSGYVTDRQPTSPTSCQNKSSIDTIDYSTENPSKEFGMLSCIRKSSSKQRKLERDHKSHIIEDANGNAIKFEVYYGTQFWTGS